jgi:hypothetical protein
MTNLSNILNEIFEPTYPKNVKVSKVKKTGTQNSVIIKDQYQFKTTIGNDVKVLFEVTNKSADIIFYVNDKLNDKSSSQDGISRDEEILPNVIGIVKRVADKKQLQTITFTAWAGEGDNKTVKNLDYKQFKDPLLIALNLFYDEIKNYQVTYLPVTDRQKETALKFNKEISPTPDIYKDILLNQLVTAKNYIENHDYKIKGLAQDLSYNKNLSKFKSFSNFLNLLKQFSDALISNSDSGLVKSRNRRKDLYVKLIQRFFTDWNLDLFGNSFELTRKNS